MATTYNTAFGSLPGYNEMLGTTNTTGGGQQQVYGQRAQQQRQQQQQPAPAQTFAQMQQRGMARPAPPSAPQSQPFAQYGGSQQAQQMRQRLQSQLETFGQTPSRFDTQAFQQIRGAQAANLQSEFTEQQRQLNEDLARRGLSASNIAASGLGRLGGAQARALADIDAQLLQRAAETQAQDRAQLLQAGQGFAELAGSQDLAEFEANRVAQAATFENQLRAAQFGQQQFEQAGQEAFQGAQAEEAAQQAARAFDQQEIERAGLTGQLGGVQTLAGRQFGEQQRQFDIQQALQEQLGLGGLEVQRGQLDVEQQRLAQQGEQFLAQLDEQQAARLQQGGFTTTELAIKRSQVDNELALQNRQLSETERNNLAIRGLQRDQFESEKDFRSEQLGLNRDELNQRADQIKEDQRLRGVEIDDQRAYRDAEIDLRTTQISNEYARAGQQIDVDKARIQAQKDISAADNAAQMARLNAQTASQERVATMETQLRRQLGMMEATGQVYQPGDGAAVTQAGGLTQSALQNAYARAAQLSQITGQQYTVNPATGAITAETGETGRTFAAQLQEAGITGTFGGRDTLQRTQMRTQEMQLLFQQAAQISEQSGFQHTVVGGQVVPLRDPATNQMLRTSATTQTEEARKQQDTLTRLDVDLRRQLGLTEATGQVFTGLDARTGQPTFGAETLQSQLQRAGLTGMLGTQETLQRKQLGTQETMQLYQQAAQISEQSGIQHGVSDGQVRPLQNPTTGAFIPTSAVSQSELERNLRRQLGMTEMTGYQFDPTGSFVFGGQTTVGERNRQIAAQTAQYQAEIASAQQRMAQDELQARLREQLIRVLSSFPVAAK